MIPKGVRELPERPPVALIPRQLEELDARVQALQREKKILDARGILSEARGRHTTSEWTLAIDDRIRKLDRELEALAAPILERVKVAFRKGEEASLRELRQQLQSSGIPQADQAYEKALSEARADPWVILDLRNAVSEGGASLKVRGDRSILASGPTPERDSYKAQATLGFRQVRAFRVEALPDASLPAGGPGRAEHGNFVLTEFRVLSGDRPLAFSGASSDFEQDRYPSSAALDGNPRTGWAISPRFGQPSTAYFHLQIPAPLEEVTFILEFQSAFSRHLLGCFRISATGVELPLPPPSRPADATPLPAAKPELREATPEIVSWREVWGKAARLASARDFAQAARLLRDARTPMKDPSLRKEAEEDEGNFLAAADLLSEIPRLLPKWTRGSKVKLEVLAVDGLPDQIEGTILESSARGLCLQSEGGTIEIPAGELGTQSVSALTALRGEKNPGLPRALAVFWATEGRSPAELPAKYSDLRGGADPLEAEARSLYWKAEADFQLVKNRAKAATAFAGLLEKYGATAFVTRNRLFLEEHLQGTRDYVFGGDDLSGAGHFSPLSPPKSDPFWLCTADSAPGKASGNFVEAEVQIDPGTSYRAWLYAGGCCQEVFTFFLQGTGLMGPSAKNPRETVTTQPGGEEWISLRPTFSGLKKKHSDHVGPKHPERWMWVELGVLKFAEPGLKTIRILTEEKGFAVATLVVSATRQGVPRDQEVKDLLRTRPPMDLGPTGNALREIWRGIDGDRIADLQGNAKYAEGKPDESGLIGAIDSSSLGTSYGCRIRGFVHPPMTGEYTFWICSDDEGELWMSPDENPTRKQKMCGLNHAVALHAWDADPSQKSQPVKLVAGQRYYVEILQKQGTGPDHVAVGWQLPSGDLERPIGGKRLSPASAFPPRKVFRWSFGAQPLEGPVARSAYLGGTGGREIEDLPKPRQLLRGFRYALASSGCFACLQPLYRGPGGESEGTRSGEGSTTGEVVARPDYAVGGIVARGTDRLNAFKVIFMRVSRWRLDGRDRYESEWIGTRAGGAEITLGADGSPVVGIFVRAGAEIDGGGLLLVGR